MGTLFSGDYDYMVSAAIKLMINKSRDEEMYHFCISYFKESLF